MFFSPENIQHLNKEYSNIQNTYSDILFKASGVSQKLKSKKANEFLLHGFGRRLKTLKRCIDNIYTLCPPNTSKDLEESVILNLSINLQAFIFNIFGCFENLALVFVEEKNIKIKRMQIGFLNNKINSKITSSLSEESKEYLFTDRFQSWRKNLKNFRDALAHRIPLYVPPKQLNPQQQQEYKNIQQLIKKALHRNDFKEAHHLNQKATKLGSMCFVMKHSFSAEEKSNDIVFHAQILSDFNTICEFADKFFKSNF